MVVSDSASGGGLITSYGRLGFGMREIGQETVPTSETDKEVFLSLRLAEPSERVKITLDERMLTIEGRRNATIDMRLHAISTMKHHEGHDRTIHLFTLS